MSRNFKVTVNGHEYDVSVLELTAGHGSAPLPPPAASVAGLSPAVASAGASPAASAPPATHAAHNPGAGDITAGMGGVVVEVLVTVGQAVTAGDRLMVLEAMKMKSPILATQGGKVTRILVTPGAAVEGGQLLLTIA